MAPAKIIALTPIIARLTHFIALSETGAAAGGSGASTGEICSSSASVTSAGGACASCESKSRSSANASSVGSLNILIPPMGLWNM